jgi:hypothetical protein
MLKIPSTFMTNSAPLTEEEFVKINVPVEKSSCRNSLTSHSLSALETTLLPNRLHQCLTQILYNSSFIFIYSMCYNCVVLFH